MLKKLIERRQRVHLQPVPRHKKTGPFWETHSALFRQFFIPKIKSSMLRNSASSFATVFPRHETPPWMRTINATGISEVERWISKGLSCRDFGSAIHNWVLCDAKVN
jgi:hypothetical protein